jgi:hypothetical protein
VHVGGVKHSQSSVRAWQPLAALPLPPYRPADCNGIPQAGGSAINCCRASLICRGRTNPSISLRAPLLLQLRLLAIFDCDQQDQLAHVVYTKTAFREHCLSLPHGSHIAITIVQQIVEEDVELTRIQKTVSLVTYDV